MSQLPHTESSHELVNTIHNQCDEMSFETMDWAAEIRSIKAAFKIGSECFFVDSSEAEIGVKSMTLFCLASSSDCEFPEYLRIGGAELSVEYSEFYRYYALDRLGEGKKGWDTAEVMVRWDNSLIRLESSDTYALIMAEALFCLQLLTPEIEQELNVTISAHQKAEWTVEYARQLRA